MHDGKKNPKQKNNTIFFIIKTIVLLFRGENQMIFDAEIIFFKVFFRNLENEGHRKQEGHGDTRVTGCGTITKQKPH